MAISLGTFFRKPAVKDAVKHFVGGGLSQAFLAKAGSELALKGGAGLAILGLASAFAVSSMLLSLSIRYVMDIDGKEKAAVTGGALHGKTDAERDVFHLKFAAAKMLLDCVITFAAAALVTAVVAGPILKVAAINAFATLLIDLCMAAWNAVGGKAEKGVDDDADVLLPPVQPPK